MKKKKKLKLNIQGRSRRNLLLCLGFCLAMALGIGALALQSHLEQKQEIADKTVDVRGYLQGEAQGLSTDQGDPLKLSQKCADLEFLAVSEDSRIISYFSVQPASLTEELVHSLLVGDGWELVGSGSDLDSSTVTDYVAQSGGQSSTVLKHYRFPAGESGSSGNERQILVQIFEMGSGSSVLLQFI